VYPAQIETKNAERQEGGWEGTSSMAFPPEVLEPDALQPETWMLGAMAGRSLAMQHLFSRMKSTAPHFRLATVEGEAGTGKLLTAQTLHRLGPAASGPFAPFTAADFLKDPDVFWRQARQGLLWLSRVDELKAEEQRELRDFLERAAHDRMRMGASATAGPLQLVAGASQPLRRLAVSGGFRSDLAAHLTAIRYALPPLRERRDDIPLLAAIFLRRWIREQSRMLRGFAPGTLARLASHEWPGNVRELEGVIAAAAVECPGQWIRPVDLPRLTWPAPGVAVVSEAAAEDPNLDRAILRHITRVLARCNGNKVRAARMLGISRSTLYRLLDGGGEREETGRETGHV